VDKELGTDVEGSGRGITRNLPGGTEENHKKFSQAHRSPGRHLSVEYLGSRASVVTSPPLRLVVTKVETYFLHATCGVLVLCTQPRCHKDRTKSCVSIILMYLSPVCIISQFLQFSCHDVFSSTSSRV
jgi:hypothetical protein